MLFHVRSRRLANMRFVTISDCGVITVNVNVCVFIDRPCCGVWSGLAVKRTNNILIDGGGRSTETW